MQQLIVSTLLFVGGHFVLSSHAVRSGLIEKLGEKFFEMAYSALILAAFAWMVFAYSQAPIVGVWEPPFFLYHVPMLLMPLAVFLIVAGTTTKSATAVGGGSMDLNDPKVLNSGILRVTRHPFLWGATLWAVSHLLVNGDAASMIMMGGILVLALGGMAHIEMRRSQALGPSWGPIQLTTSVIPFAAILSGRTQMDWAGIGWWRLLLSIAVFLALFVMHVWVIGVSPFRADRTP